MKRHFILIVLVSSVFSLYPAVKKGVCCIPVADLTTQQPKSLQTAHTFGMAPEKDSANVLGRVSQILLNDPVFITESTTNHYKVTVPDHYYGTSKTGKNNSFWIKKEAIAVTDFTIANQDRVTTLQPLTIPELSCTVSAGTCFNLLSSTASNYRCNSLHPHTKKIVTFSVPKKYCCKPYKKPTDKRTAFVKIVQHWAQQKPYKIPYVFGGSSVIDVLPADDFKLIPTSTKKNAKIYIRPQARPPYTGLDCAHMVFLAARITGIPITSINTLALDQELKPLGLYDTLKAGDIALWKGHVVVITDLENGKIAEARGYPAGYGIVHELPLAEQFKNIATVNDLIRAYRIGQPIIRLNKQGNPVQTITDLKLYRLPV